VNPAAAHSLDPYLPSQLSRLPFADFGTGGVYRWCVDGGTSPLLATHFATGNYHGLRHYFSSRAVPPQYPPSTSSPLLSRYYERTNLVVDREPNGSPKGVRTPLLHTPRTRVAPARYHGPRPADSASRRSL
jgi:hypothetical protein